MQLTETSDPAINAGDPRTIQAPILNRLSALICLLLVICGIGIFVIVRGSRTAETRWEYRIEDVPDRSFNDEMNKMGEEGWELVFARRASDGSEYHPTMSYEMILKRPKRLNEPK